MAPTKSIGPDVKKGSAELLVLALVEERARHGYEIGKLIEERSGGVLKFHIASLYPMLYRLEERGLIQGRWVEKAGQRRRRFYRITAEGRRVLASHRTRWEEFIARADARRGDPTCLNGRQPLIRVRRSSVARCRCADDVVDEIAQHAEELYQRARGGWCHGRSGRSRPSTTELADLSCSGPRRAGAPRRGPPLPEPPRPGRCHGDSSLCR